VQQKHFLFPRLPGDFEDKGRVFCAEIRSYQARTLITFQRLLPLCVVEALGEAFSKKNLSGWLLNGGQNQRFPEGDNGRRRLEGHY
jgi:hypothetical protein